MPCEPGMAHGRSTAEKLPLERSGPARASAADPGRQPLPGAPTLVAAIRGRRAQPVPGAITPVTTGARSRPTAAVRAARRRPSPRPDRARQRHRCSDAGAIRQPGTAPEHRVGRNQRGDDRRGRTPGLHRSAAALGDPRRPLRSAPQGAAPSQRRYGLRTLRRGASPQLLHERANGSSTRSEGGASRTTARCGARPRLRHAAGSARGRSHRRSPAPARLPRPGSAVRHCRTPLPGSAPTGSAARARPPAVESLRSGRPEGPAPGRPFASRTFRR